MRQSYGGMDGLMQLKASSHLSTSDRSGIQAKLLNDSSTADLEEDENKPKQAKLLNDSSTADLEEDEKNKN